MSFRVKAYLIELAKNEFKGRSIDVITLILKHHNNRWGYADPGYRYICKTLGCSERTVYFAIKDAERAGFLSVERFPRGSLRNNRYRTALQLVKKAAAFFKKNDGSRGRGKTQEHLTDALSSYTFKNHKARGRQEVRRPYRFVNLEPMLEPRSIPVLQRDDWDSDRVRSIIETVVENCKNHYHDYLMKRCPKSPSFRLFMRSVRAWCSSNDIESEPVSWDLVMRCPSIMDDRIYYKQPQWRTREHNFKIPVLTYRQAIYRLTRWLSREQRPQPLKKDHQHTSWYVEKNHIEYLEVDEFEPSYLFD